MTVAAILAGGRASRMGGAQKALLEVDGRAILDRQLDALGLPANHRKGSAGMTNPGGRPAVDEVAVVLPAGAGAAEEAPFAARGLVLLRDGAEGRGPVEGLATALAWSGARPLLALACDMPYVTREAIDVVLAHARASGADLALPVVGGRREPLLAWYGPRCAAIVRGAADGGRPRLRDLPDAARAAGLVVEEIDEGRFRNDGSDLRAFVNVNEPRDRR